MCIIDFNVSKVVTLVSNDREVVTTLIIFSIMLMLGIFMMLVAGSVSGCSGSWIWWNADGSLIIFLILICLSVV